MTARRILYIDDDDALCSLVRKDLVRHGYSVETAGDGEAGIAAAARGSFDAIALDHFLPDSTGIELLSKLMLSAGDPPVIYVTASDDVQTAVGALKAGAADFVFKEVSGQFLSHLRKAIEQSLTQAALRREKEAAERAVREARDRAEVMLREVNHRVANSLTLILTFVRLQSASVLDPQARAVLNETQNRIQAVGKVHRSLYTSDDVRAVSMREYLGELTKELERSLASEIAAHRIVSDIDPVAIPTDKAVAVGVIVTELVTNAFKYAYPGRAEEGEVRVRLKRQPDSFLSLAVEDDGVGLAGSGRSGTSLGMRIVEAMAQNLHSSVEFDQRSRGTRAVIAFNG